MIFRGCYSRPLWPYNKYLHAQIEDNGDYDFDEKDKAVFERRIYNELLEKIKRMEDMLYSDLSSLTEA